MGLTMPEQGKTSMPTAEYVAHENGADKAIVYWHPTCKQVDVLTDQVERALLRYWPLARDSEGKMHLFHYCSMTMGEA